MSENPINIGVRNHVSNLVKWNKKKALAIIPIGFRCHTTKFLNEKIGISQPSYPFDVGFFSPHSISSILRYPKVSLDYMNPSSFDICKKKENYQNPTYGKGIKFIRSNKQEIDALVKTKDKNGKDINRFLDSTFGYYTLDNNHKYILAHYNWHLLADKVKSDGCSDMRINLEKASGILNRRISRMIKTCNSAKVVILVFHNPNEYKFMQIDDEIFDLEDLSEIKEVACETFQSKIIVVSDQELIYSKVVHEKIRQQFHDF